MIIPINWLNYFVAIYRYMKMTYCNHDMEDYIDYHDIRYILHITNKGNGGGFTKMLYRRRFTHCAMAIPFILHSLPCSAIFL